MNAAMAIILEKGPGGLTMRHLAETMNMTAGALYRYFPTKGEIIGGLGNRSLNLYAKTILEGVAVLDKNTDHIPPKANALRRIMTVHKTYIDLSIRSFANYRILNMIMVHPERFMTSESDYKQFMTSAVKLLRYVGLLFDGATEVGALREGNGFERSLMLTSLMNGALQLIKFEEELPDLINNASIRQQALEHLLLGMGATKVDVEEARKKMW